MAQFDLVLPDEVVKEIKQVNANADDIFGAMTRAGAEVVFNNIKSNIPASFKNSDIMSCLKITETYKTESDGGINTKVGFYGYFYNHNDVLTPAPLVANVYEYGRSNASFPKQPFFRKSFGSKTKIEKAMMEAQKNASKGLLT